MTQYYFVEIYYGPNDKRNRVFEVFRPLGLARIVAYTRNLNRPRNEPYTYRVRKHGTKYASQFNGRGL
jgi:hypothetical protein